MKLQLSYEIMFGYVQKLRLVCQSLDAHFPTYVFHSYNSPQTHEHNAPSLQQPLVFTHNYLAL